MNHQDRFSGLRRILLVDVVQLMLAHREKV